MYLQLCGLVDERGRQVVLVLQQGAHLLHLLLQRLLHLNRSLGNKHMYTNKNFTTTLFKSLVSFTFLVIPPVVDCLHPVFLFVSYDTKIINTGTLTTVEHYLIKIDLFFLFFCNLYPER